MKPNFNIGDKVRCINPTCELELGAIYTITGWDEEWYEPRHVLVSLAEVATDQYNWYADRFEKLIDTPKQKLKVGDRVFLKISSGITYTVTNVFRDQDTNELLYRCLHVVDEFPSSKHFIYTTDGDIVEIGYNDRVRINNGSFKGVVGHIVYVTEDSYEVVVDRDSDESNIITIKKEWCESV
jgi:ribosomal protein L21E